MFHQVLSTLHNCNVQNSATLCKLSECPHAFYHKNSKHMRANNFETSKTFFAHLHALILSNELKKNFFRSVIELSNKIPQKSDSK